MKGRRFGAFIKVNWDRSKLNVNIKDTNAFMFSLDTKKYYPIKSGGDHAIRYRSVGDCQIFGGVIGDNYEEYIGLECHANYMSVKNCHENQGKYYDVPTPHELSNESDWFMIKEVETFQITFLNDTLNCELYNCKECKNDLDKDDVICKNCLEGYILIENKYISLLATATNNIIFIQIFFTFFAII